MAACDIHGTKCSAHLQGDAQILLPEVVKLSKLSLEGLALGLIGQDHRLQLADGSIHVVILFKLLGVVACIQPSQPASLEVPSGQVIVHAMQR